MEKIKAIFFDFDWTLFDHKTKSFNAKSIKALKKLHKKGVKLIINSARTYYSLKNLHTFDVYSFDGFVVSNGGAAIFNNKVLYFDGFKAPSSSDPSITSQIAAVPQISPFWSGGKSDSIATFRPAFLNI